MYQNKFRSALNGTYQFTKKLGEDFGKLTALVALPSVCVAAAAFYSEIPDIVTAPDISGDIVSLELRCGVEIDSIDQLRYAQENFGKVCGDAPFAISFAVNLSNEDAIERTIVDVHARISFPALEEDRLELRLARVVKHSVINYTTQTSEDPWQVVRLAPREVRKIELQFRPLQRDHHIPFSKFRNLIRQTPSPLEGTKISAEFWAVNSRKSDNESRVAQCNAVFKSDAIERVRTLSDDGLVSFVLECSENADAY